MQCINKMDLHEFFGVDSSTLQIIIVSNMRGKPYLALN